jgi:hypothetical protein
MHQKKYEKKCCKKKKQMGIPKTSWTSPIVKNKYTYMLEIFEQEYTFPSFSFSISTIT